MKRIAFVVWCCICALNADASDHSVVSQDSITPDVLEIFWQNLNLTEAQTKAGYPFVLEPKRKSWPLFLIGGAAAGALGYIILSDLKNGCDIRISAELKHPTCGQENGCINITILSEGRYDIEWSLGQTTRNINNLRPTTYTVSLYEEDTGCNDFFNFVLRDETPDIDIQVLTTNTDCSPIDNGTAVVVSSFSGTPKYTWSNGGTTQRIENLSPGDYTVTVNYGGSCVVTQTGTVEMESPEFHALVTTTPAHCGYEDGTALLAVNPPGNYSFIWPDGSTGSGHSKLASGTYEVIVFGEKNCSITENVTISEIPVKHIETMDVTPATCTGEGGEIIIQCTNALSSSYGIILTDPAGEIHEVTQQNPVFKASEWLSLLPGTYTVSVYDSLAGKNCAETRTVEIEQVPSQVTARNDSTATSINQAVTIHLLLNDEGKNLRLMDVFGEQHVTATYQNDGTTELIPEPDYKGEAGFFYIVSDTCGTTDTAFVYLLVTEEDCTYTADFFFQPSECGLATGFLEVLINPPANYTYLWNNGVTTRENEMIPAGTYTVEVRKPGTSCVRSFTATLAEIKSPYVSNIQQTDFTCSESGDIVFDFTPLGNGPYHMEVFTPIENANFLISPGTIRMSDYTDMVPGFYFITVYDEEAGIDCGDEFVVELINNGSLDISLVSIMPPSGPTSMDGVVTIEITTPGFSPYQIYVNDAFYGLSTDLLIPIEGFAFGTYEIYVIDAGGCKSNTLEVEITTLNFEVGFFSKPTALSVHTSEVEGSGVSELFPRAWIRFDLPYRFVHHSMTLSSLSSHPNAGTEALWVQYLASVVHQFERFNVSGGVRLDAVYHQDRMQPFYGLNTTVGYQPTQWLGLRTQFDLDVNRGSVYTRGSFGVVYRME